ncbi:hypothetical protein [Saccharopolyspora spinosa]|uniref:Uncharacterized protein n=1 Tax=Saccharopolyspora spinosa TaxID=60894 RepID=A0A2N3XY41_SACSN|nr:hypothetical protein [Saccharopolyspora spinosa]PKW15562.1 hypothetical protein A8926_3292 [Saccharopolyspora spinosa]
MLVRIKVYLAAFIGYLLGRWRMGKAALRLARLLARKKLTIMGPARRRAASNQRKLQLQRAGLTAAGVMAGAGAAYAAYRMTRSVTLETSEAEQPAGEGPPGEGAVSLGESTDETIVPPEGAIPAAREAPKARAKKKAAEKGVEH